MHALARTLPATRSGQTPATAHHGTQSLHRLFGRVLRGIVARYVVLVHLAATVDSGDVQHLAVARPGSVHVGPGVPRVGLVNYDLGEQLYPLVLAFDSIRELRGSGLACDGPGTVAGLKLRHRRRNRRPASSERRGRRGGALWSEGRVALRLGGLYFLSGWRTCSSRIGKNCDRRRRRLSGLYFPSRRRTCASRISENCDGWRRRRLARRLRTRTERPRWRQRSAGKIRHCNKQSSSAQSASEVTID